MKCYNIISEMYSAVHHSIVIQIMESKFKFNETTSIKDNIYAHIINFLITFFSLSSLTLLNSQLNLYSNLNIISFFPLQGIFFILPCIDAYARVDLRTRTYDVPPQEVRLLLIKYTRTKTENNFFSVVCGKMCLT